jgi:hypothetical protein
MAAKGISFDSFRVLVLGQRREFHCDDNNETKELKPRSWRILLFLNKVVIRYENTKPVAGLHQK